MRVMIKEPCHKSKLDHILDDLEVYHRIVNCQTIDAIQLFNRPDICMIIDDEGKLVGKKPNFYYGLDIIVGTVIFAGVSGEDLVSLNDEQIKFVNALCEVNDAWR